MRGFISAVRTLSILPIPGKDVEKFDSALPWFPVVGGILGLIVYGLWYLITNTLNVGWAQLGAFVALIAGVLITRALHMDGVSDWADSFGSINNRERMFEIMKDSRVGAFGVLAAVLVLIGKFIALVKITEAGAGYWIIVAYTVSRLMQAEAAGALPYAGNASGIGRGFIGDAGLKHMLIALAVGAIPLIGFFKTDALVALGVGGVVCVLFSLHCYYRYGGATGDLLGTGSEFTELAVLITGALTAGG